MLLPRIHTVAIAMNPERPRRWIRVHRWQQAYCARSGNTGVANGAYGRSISFASTAMVCAGAPCRSANTVTRGSRWKSATAGCAGLWVRHGLWARQQVP